MKLRLTGSVPVDYFKEGDTFVAYCPVLELSSCGATYKEAAHAFAEALSIFLQECMERKTLDKVLQSLGWNISTTPSGREIAPPLFIGQRQVSLKMPTLEECPL